MALTILQVAYPLAPVSLDAVGGAEQVLALLDAGLTRLGVRSLVVACAGSRVAGTLLELPAPPAVLDEAARAHAWQAVRERLTATLRAYPVDLVHLHGVDFPAYLPEPGPPCWPPCTCLPTTIRAGCWRRRGPGSACAASPSRPERAVRAPGRK